MVGQGQVEGWACYAPELETGGHESEGKEGEVRRPKAIIMARAEAVFLVGDANIADSARNFSGPGRIFVCVWRQYRA